MNNTKIIITKKKIKHMYVRILEGNVYVSVPMRMEDSFIDTFVKSRWKWIEKHLSNDSAKKKEKTLYYQTGEEHVFLGRSYLLQAHHNYTRSHIYLTKNTMHMYISSLSTVAQRKKTLELWYKKKLAQLLILLSKKWNKRMKVELHEIRVRYMKTRWGTCNIRAKRIWMSSELVKKPLGCIEYVFVHEMVHLFERLHNKKFYSLMSYFLPDWKEREKMLKIC